MEERVNESWFVSQRYAPLDRVLPRLSVPVVSAGARECDVLAPSRTTRLVSQRYGPPGSVLLVRVWCIRCPTDAFCRQAAGCASM